MTRREPVQRRSRERVEQLLAAATELLAEGGVEALTTRALAEYTGIPVGTIYRYFDNRDAIIAAYLDRELAKIEQSVAESVLALERVTLRSLTEATALAHMRHHQAHPEGVGVWFGGRLNPAVVERVRVLDAGLAAGLTTAITSVGMLADVPDFGTEMIVRLFDRMFEFVFLAERTTEEQETIVRTFIDMLINYAERYVTPTGVEGVSAEDFVIALAANSGRAQTPEKVAPTTKKRT